jgi:N-acetylmuramoyl-L-alanine amidase
MTPVGATTSSGREAFNVSLKDGGGKSTKEASCRVKVAACKMPVADFTQAANHQRQAASFKVVLDAGHGGKDPGGMGAISHEKSIALKIVQLLAIGIRTNFPGVEVILTRADDTFIPLYERAKIANDEGADLFISVHANIMPGSSATHGTETFVMGQHVASHNLAVAKRENASILLEDRVEENYGYDPNSDEGHILMSTFQHAFLERSILFADLVEKEFAAAGRKSRGVKQAGFVVLKQTTMPAVLVETGFMSNPEEEMYLLSSSGQQRLANAILKAFQSYYRLLNGQETASPVAMNTTPSPRASGVYAPPATPVAVPLSRSATPVPTTRSVNVYDREVTARTTPSPTAPTPTMQRQWTAKGMDPQPITYGSFPLSVQGPTTAYPATSQGPVTYGMPVAYGTPAPNTARLAGNSLPPRSEASKRYESVLSKEVASSPGARPSLYDQARQPGQIMTDTVPKKYTFGEAGARRAATETRIDLAVINDNQLLYAVQLIATKRTLDLNTAEWQRIPYPILLVAENGWNKYQVRGLKTAAEAEAAKLRIKATGHQDALVAVYYQGHRLLAPQVNYLLSR